MVTSFAAGTLINSQVRLARRPVGVPVDEDWSIEKSPVTEPGLGQVLVGVLYASVDPAMRAWVSGARTYREPVEIGDLVPAAGIGRVLSSQSDILAVGDLVTGDLGIQRYATVDARSLMSLGDVPDTELPFQLSVLGIPGLTAWVGLHAVAELKAGETALISGAAGAVGSVAGQLARARGARVVGVAGGPAKCDHVVNRLGFDACVDHRSPTMADDLANVLPDGVDVFFDNVGGAVLEAALDNLARGARILLCGAISQYNAPMMAGPANYMQLLVARASMTGFLVFDHARRFGEARREISDLLRSDVMHVDTHLRDGLEAFPDALRGLFEGSNYGKVLLRVTEERPHDNMEESS